MTTKVFWKNPYLCELATTVKSVQGNIITLNETIFYAFSGGQESDAGTIHNLTVIDARKDGKEIYYTLPDEHGLTSNTEVIVSIDWERRYQLMRLHFAAELVLELVCEEFPDVVKIGAHIGQNKARIDFKWNQNITPHIPMLQQKAQTTIDQDHKIISAFDDETNERRYWQIPNLAKVPCGGTHIKRTSEVGHIKLKRANPGKGKERIIIYV